MLPNLEEKHKEKPLCYPYSVKARALLHAHFNRVELPQNTLEIGNVMGKKILHSFSLKFFLQREIKWIILCDEFIYCVVKHDKIYIKSTLCQITIKPVISVGSKFCDLLYEKGYNIFAVFIFHLFRFYWKKIIS